MAKGKTFGAKLALGKRDKRTNEKGEEIVSVKILRPTAVEGKPGVYRYREEMVEVTASSEKEVYGG